MLRAYARKHRKIRLHQRAKFGDVPDAARPHLRDKNLFIRKFPARHRLGDSDGRIIRFGRSHDRIFCGKDAFQNILDRRLPAAAYPRHANDFRFVQYPSRPSDESFIAGSFVKSVRGIGEA